MNTCEDCKYFDNDEDDFYGLAQEDSGLCRRYPPQHFVMTHDFWKYGDEPQYRSEFPQAFSDHDWCGEFQPKQKGENHATETIEDK